AILIISVVLGALFELGVFNANNFAPKAPPGACQVFRPNGPGTTSFINLEGVCNGELPEYVMSVGTSSSHYIIVNDTSFNSTFMETHAVSLSAWIYELTNSECEVSFANMYPISGWLPGPVFRFGVGGGSWGNGVLLELFTTSTQTNMQSTNSVPYNTWTNIAATWNGSDVAFYINGNLDGISTYNSILSYGPKSAFIIGSNFNSGCNSYFPGYISNLQLYDSSLSANDIKALYTEGIGGAPIDLQSLIGWWPLNGNANDYSGNDNNGQATGVTYVTNWYSGYTPP
ncbi:MAG: LamG domain-containing protein, partial [Candidatus Micrarchaeaceae archaeon]